MNFFGSKKLLEDWMAQQNMPADDIFALPAHLALQTAHAIFSLDARPDDTITNVEKAL